MRSLVLAVTVSVVLAGAASSAPSAIVSGLTNRPERVGQCFSTTVRQVETRLEDGNTPVAGSGSAIEFADGHYNVSYDQLPGIDRSRPGDPVRLCVVTLPAHCPAGDTRGIRYRGRNLRTGLSWIASDSEHDCGGA